MVPISGRAQRNPSSQPSPWCVGIWFLISKMGHESAYEWVPAGTGVAAYPLPQPSHYHRHILAQIIILLA